MGGRHAATTQRESSRKFFLPVDGGPLYFYFGTFVRSYVSSRTLSSHGMYVCM